jgi:hypothetical protein
MGRQRLTDDACGSVKGYYRHYGRGETTCQDCRDAIAAHQRERYQQNPPPKRPPAECGTNGGYYRHVYRRETTCDACKAAHSRDGKVRRETIRILRAMETTNA